MRSILKFLVLLIFCVTLHECFGFERVKLKNVGALTLYKGRYTIGRKPISQLICKSSSGLCRNQPEVVQCQNVGFDGKDYQW